MLQESETYSDRREKIPHVLSSLMKLMPSVDREVQAVVMMNVSRP